MVKLYHHQLAPGNSCSAGNVVRFGPNRLSFNTSSALNDIYAVHANNQKSRIYNGFKHVFKVAASMSTTDKRIHGIKRRINVRAFSQNARSGSEEFILKNARVFCDRLVDDAASTERSLAVDKEFSQAAQQSQWSSARDMTAMAAYVTSDIMGDLTFNRNWNMLLSEENRWILRTLSGGVACINMVTPAFLVHVMQADDPC